MTESLVKAVRRAMDNAASLPAKQSVKLVPDDWHKVITEADNTAARITALEAENARLREALAKARSWHESEDKALSKSGRSDTAYHWARCQHREQINEIKLVLPDADYDAAWGRLNARADLGGPHE